MNSFSDNTNRQKNNSLRIAQLFDRQCIASPDQVAIVCGNESITYQTLNDRANSLAGILTLTAGESDIISISAAKNISTVIGLLAILKAGKAYLPLDPSYPTERLTQIIADSKINYCLASRSEGAFFESLGLQVLVLDDQELTETFVQGEPSTNLAYVLYTSGSTGKPKGVCMGNDALVNLLLWQKENSASAVGFNTLQYAPLTFDVSFQEIFSTLTTGGTLFLVDDELRLDPVKLLEFIDQQKINRVFLPFVALQYLTEASETKYPASLKEVMTAGEQLKITAQVIKFFKALPGCVLFNQYGPTESHVVTQLMLSGDPEQWPALPGIGTPVDDIEILILNEHLEQLAYGEQGELCISGVCLADGYLNRPDLTAEKFIEWTSSSGKIQRIYKTGDLAQIHPDGNTEYLGRIDNQVKIRGNRVEPGEIEVLLSHLKGINQAVVVAKEYGGGQKRLIAYLVAEGEERDTNQIKAYLSNKLPDYMVPSAFVWMEELPKTSSGKVDRNALPDQVTRRPDLNVLYASPQNITQTRIAGLWEDLLQFDRIGINDNFFDLGGNSLLAINTVSALRLQFGYTLPVAKLYQFPTVEGIASYLDGELIEPVLKPVQRKKIHSGGDIAVIAMAGKFPGANNIDEFWELLKAGKETTSFFSESELDEAIPSAIKNNPAYVKARGIIDEPGGFDAAFFKITPRMAELMDPQQRLFLELSSEALEVSGYYPKKYGDGIGVYSGCANNTYYYNNVLTNPELVEQTGSFQVMTFNEKDYIATRTAYELNLKGPAISVYAACSTSLLAIAQAVDALRNGHCAMALAGGVTITSPVKSGHIYQEGAMLSKDGHCRPFDAMASGTVFSDGGGVVLLKPLEDARQDGDIIYAVIKGTGVNNDGGGKGSFTAPNSTGQAGAIATAIEDARVDPADISYVEAHGTATPLGDPIEIEGLKMAFGNQGAKQYCAIGSVKSNMGHLTAASGVAGFIKTALCIHHQQLVPSLYYEQANPAIEFSDSPFYVNTDLKNWESDIARTAGVSSFGVGGTNVHVILQENKINLIEATSGRPFHLVNWSAKTDGSRDKYAFRLNEFLNNKDIYLADVAYTLNTSRAGFNHRRFEVVADLPELNQKLLADKPGPIRQHVLQQKANEIVFMFPGQGAQYVNMAKELYLYESVFKTAVEECATIILKYSGIEIRDFIYPDGDETGSKQKLTQTLYIQPAIFTVEYAIAKLWISWGIKPTALLGHSIGEFVAAHFAGVVSLDEVLKLITARAALIDQLPQGSMLALRASLDDMQRDLPLGLSIGVINSHNLYVISGEPQLVDDYANALDKRNIASRLLNVSHALHSPMVDGVIEPFKNIVEKVNLNRPRIPVVSSITGKWLTDDEAMSPEYWATHMRKTVNFAAALQTVTEDGNRVLLECGPGNVTATLAKNQAGTKPGQLIIPGIDEQAGSAYRPLLNALGRLWLNGIEPDWKGFYAGQKRRKIMLPAYVFDHKNYWLRPGNLSYITPLVSVSADDATEQNETEEDIMREEILTTKIREIFEAASGINMNEVPESMSFAEAGFDSLLLTQIALNLKKQFSLPFTFRKMYEEYSNISLLTRYIDGNLPADAYQPIKKIVARDNMSNNQSQLDLITQQMRLLTEQISMMQNGQAGQHLQPVPVHVSASHGLTPEELVEIKKPFGATARIERHSLELNDKQREFLKQLTVNYNRKTTQSKTYTQQHRNKMADPRVVSGFRPVTKEIVYPLVVDRSKGSRIWDIDGNEYVDALNGFGSNFLGYNPDFLKEVFQQQIEKGYEIGPQHVLAGEVCDLICEFTGFERAALCNTGSEAVLGAMRMARTVTGRSLIVAFSGSYHGINDEVLVRGTKILKTIPAAAGIMPEVVQNMLILDYGTDESLEIIRQRAGEFAAVLVEPVQSRRPEFQPVEFLRKVREITKAAGTALIFDEVITGFRMHPGGAQALFNIRADIGTYGKVIGGGMPIGVIAGAHEFMDALDGGTWSYGDNSMPEAGVTYFAGTFVRHPLALAGAKAVLTYLKENGAALQQGINQLTEKLANKLNAICKNYKLPFFVAHFGSLWKIKFNYEVPYGELLFTLLRYKGVHIWDIFPCFLTEAHKDEDVEFITEKFRESVAELLLAGFFPTVEQSNMVEKKLDIFSPSPVSNARLGRDIDGNPAWFINDPNNPGKFLQVEIKNN